MVKVIIVDDEPLVRLGLKSMIDWEGLGYEICGEAPNGQLGLDLIRKYQPEIIITDIKMPVMDGLEMMRRALAEQTPARFIILSSYDEFQLVKQAMKLGAEEYLIKLNLEPEILTSTLALAREQILRQRDRSGSSGRLEQELRKNVTMLREGFFKRLIGKPVQSEEELKTQIDYLGIELDEILSCACVRLNDPMTLEKYNSEDLRSLEGAILDIVNEIVNDVFKGYTFVWNPGEFVAIFSAPSGLTDGAFLSKATDMGERIAQMVKQYCNLAVLVGLGNPCKGYSGLSEGYLEALQAVQQCQYTGARTVLGFADLPNSGVEREQIDITNQKDILPQAVELHDLEMIGSVFETVIAIVNDPKVSREQAYDLCFQIAYSVTGALKMGETELKEALGYKNSLYESILTRNTLGEISEWLLGLERNLCRLISQSGEQKNHRLIAKAKKYIVENYTKEIGLNEVAAAINISPGYLSTVFKQDTGICFTDYVTEIKIGQAKKLLHESEYKICEISEMLGFQNAYYFSKVFKKVTGMTPSEFAGQKIDPDQER